MGKRGGIYIYIYANTNLLHHRLHICIYILKPYMIYTACLTNNVNSISKILNHSPLPRKTFLPLIWTQSVIIRVARLFFSKSTSSTFIWILWHSVKKQWVLFRLYFKSTSLIALECTIVYSFAHKTWTKGLQWNISCPRLHEICIYSIIYLNPWFHIKYIVQWSTCLGCLWFLTNSNFFFLF